MKKLAVIILATLALSLVPSADCTSEVDLRARLCCGDVVLTWTAPVEPCLHYRVYRGTLGDYTTPPVLLATVRGTTTYTDAGAGVGPSGYWYDVRPGKRG